MDMASQKQEKQTRSQPGESGPAKPLGPTWIRLQPDQRRAINQIRFPSYVGKSLSKRVSYLIEMALSVEAHSKKGLIKTYFPEIIPPEMDAGAVDLHV
jgi:hypothetical protein